MVPISKFQCEFLALFPSILDPFIEQYNIQITGIEIQDKNKKKLEDSQFVTLTGKQPNLDSALIKFNTITSQIKTRALECKFGPHESIFREYIEKKLITTAQIQGQVLASGSTSDQRSFLLVVINLVAMETEMANCSTAVKSMSDSLTSEEYIFPGTVPPLNKVEQDFDVKIIEENKKHRIFGPKDTITAVKEHLNLMLGKEFFSS